MTESQTLADKGCFLDNRLPTTVEPPIVDPPRWGHNIIDLSTKDTGQGPKKLLPYSPNTF